MHSVSSVDPHHDNGFTLIEIVMVLVLLGLLAATATPKFFDLSHGSQRLAAETAFNEAQVRISARFSRLMYAGLLCEDAVKSVNTLALVADKTEGDEARFGSFMLSPAEKEIPEEGLAVSVRLADNKDHVFRPGKLYVPACVKYETKDANDDKFTVDPDSPGNPDSKDPDTDDGSSSGTDTGDSGSSTGSNSGSDVDGGSSSSNNHSGNGAQGSLNSALAGFEVFDWTSLESTITLPAGRLVLYDGKYYVTKMTAVVDTVANKPVGDDALTGYFVEVNVKQIATELNCQPSDPCRPGLLWKDGEAGEVYAYVGTVDLIVPVTPAESSDWVKLV
mgnify:FL=1